MILLLISSVRWYDKVKLYALLSIKQAVYMDRNNRIRKTREEGLMPNENY